jgi:putative membrane protein
MVLGVVPVVAYQIGNIKWLGIPWTVVALLGTATAFIVGFKNLQTYNRTWEARQIWGDIINSSRAWGTMSRDFFDNAEKSKELVYRHLAWLTALRYQLRENRAWETTSKAHNAEYLKYYSIPEMQTALETELAKYLPDAELKQILATGSKATQIMSLQSKTIKELSPARRLSWRSSSTCKGQSRISSCNKADVNASRISRIQGNMQPSIPFSSNCSAFCFPSGCSGNSTSSMTASRG